MTCDGYLEKESRHANSEIKSIHWRGKWEDISLAGSVEWACHVEEYDPYRTPGR